MTAKKTASTKAASAAELDPTEKKKIAKAAKATSKAGDAKVKPGTKVNSKAKEELPDDDFSDIDTDLQDEPEAEVEVEADADPASSEDDSATKAKPLRMKVSRAKERALMREFGLDETALTEEEVAKRRFELKTLIKMGKTRGFLTHQEISDHLPEKLVDAEIL
jgi:RNA polymerase primary sigma factor